MKIAILATDSDPRGLERLVESGQQRGHEMVVLDILSCSVSVSSEKSCVHYEGQELDAAFDAILPRIDVPHTEYGFTVLRQFDAMGYYVVDTPLALARGRDKFRCFQHLIKSKVPIPMTGFAHSKEDYDVIISTVGGPPLIIKLIEGTEGVGVFLAEDEKSAKNIIWTLRQLDSRIVVQEFIKESSGEDIRCFVVGDDIVASIRRKATDGDFRANVAQGAAADVIELSEDEKRVALRAAKSIGLNIAGVDLIRSKKGPMVIEINTSPAFNGLEQATGMDIPAEIFKYVEKQAKKHKKAANPSLVKKVIGNVAKLGS